MIIPHTFVANTTIDPAEVNENFVAVNNALQSQDTLIQNYKNQINSSLSNTTNTLNDRINSFKNELQNSIDDLDSSVSALSSKSFAPDFSSGISVSLPYTVVNDGWMFLVVDGYDSVHYATVNGQHVGASCGYSGGKAVRNGVMFMVSADDVVAKANVVEARYYPMKGA